MTILGLNMSKKFMKNLIKHINTITTRIDKFSSGNLIIPSL